VEYIKLNNGTIRDPTETTASELEYRNYKYDEQITPRQVHEFFLFFFEEQTLAASDSDTNLL
jgi:hypothetical protein